MNISYSTQITAISVLGSFVFGYSMAAINAIANTVVWALQWCSPGTIYCDLHVLFIGLVSGSYFIGTASGALLAGCLVQYGRRRTILIADGIVCVACIVIVMCPRGFPPPISCALLFSAHLLQGVGCGLHLVLAPVFISEWAPDVSRRSHLCFHQILISFGIFVAVAMGSLLDSPPTRPMNGQTLWWNPENEAFDRAWWRVMLGMPLIPCLVQALFLLIKFRDETPMQRISEGDVDGARKSFEQIYGMIEVDAAFHELCREHADASQESMNLKTVIFSPTYRYILGVGISFALLHQLTGYNFAVSQSIALFMECGISGRGAQLASVAMMFVHFVLTAVVVRLLTIAGRRRTLLRSFGGMACSMAFACAFSFDRRYLWASHAATISTIFFVCFFALGVGPLTWVVVAEFFPLSIRSYGVSWAVFANQLGAFLVVVVSAGLPSPFLLYAIFSLLNIAGVCFVLKFFTVGHARQSQFTIRRERRCSLASTNFDSGLDDDVRNTSDSEVNYTVVS